MPAQYTYLDSKLLVTFYLWYVQFWQGCNRGHGLSAAIKLGSLEKTIIASLFHSGLHSATIFLWKKQCHMLFWGTTGYVSFDKKKTNIFYAAK